MVARKGVVRSGDRERNWPGGRWRARRKSVGRNCVARRGKDSIGRVAADRKAGADYAGNSKCCSRGKKLVGVSSEAWAVVGWKSADETV